MQDIDIWRTAKLLIDQHGDKAAMNASQQADTQLERGDVEGNIVWLRIYKAIEELSSTKPTGMIN